MAKKPEERLPRRRCARSFAGDLVLFLSTIAIPATAVEALTLPAVRDELLVRASIDQYLRQAVSVAVSAPFDEAGWNRVRIIDAGNTRWLKSVVARHGWPERSKVGDAAAHAAWLLAQHADREPAFQRHCLELIEALPEGEVSGKSRAYLTDRVRRAEGQSQLFGSQLRGDCSTGFTAHPIEDEAHVDERRLRLGLQTLNDYLNAAPSVLCSTENEK